MWEERAHRISREVVALAATGIGVSQLHAAAIDMVGAAVGSELTCWAAIDPETLVISAMTSGRDHIPMAFEPLLADAEYATEEPHRFAALAARGEALARLSDLPAAARNRSVRFANVWRPLGMDRELRVLFQADGACWGAAGLVRGGQDFTDREADLLVAVAPAIAAATRVCVRAEIRAVAPPESPAIVVVGPSGALHWLTPAALSWRERIDEISRGRFLTMMNIMAAGMRGSPSGEFRGKMRDASGRWAVLHAAPLVGADGPSAAVVITAASGRDVAGLLLAAYGLTLREREICAEVLAGGTTAQISDRLCISAHTVQDHLKSIFAKVSVHSRGQLAARLQPGMDAAAR